MEPSRRRWVSKIPFAVGAVVLLSLGSAVSVPRAEAAGNGCADVRCSGHGACGLEANRPYCFCDAGYAAQGLRCEPARGPRLIHRRLRSSATGLRIAQVATLQNGRRRWRVGDNVAGYPHALGRYLRPGEMWCSDFISWVYRVAGVPFTGGYEGGWLLTNNRAIRSWFQRQNLWVERGSVEYRTFVPQPGDYLRMDTRRGWGHSAIVDHVDGETLYTVEGNVGNRVRTRVYHHFRTRRHFDGFGIVTFPDARRRALARAIVRRR